MKAKRLINKYDMRAIIRDARLRTRSGEPVFVAKLIEDHFAGRRKATTQMRRIVAAELDRLKIPRARRVDRPVTFQDIAIKAKTCMSRLSVTDDTLDDYKGMENSIPGVLGGMSQDDSDVIDVSLPDDVQAKCDEYAGRLERIREIDRELSKMADDGNYAALSLLMHRLRTR